MFAMQGLGSYPITLSGNEAQKAKYVGGAADGSLIAAFAITEPEAGSDVKGMSTVATRDGDDWVINGSKTFISNAGLADFYTLFCRTGEEEFSAFIIEKDAPGFALAEAIDVIAPHPIGTISFTDCRVPDSARLGEIGTGLDTALGTLAKFRVSVGSAAVGLAHRALDEALKRVSSRKQFGRALGDFQGTRMRLADMKVELDASRLLVQRAAHALETKDEAGMESSIAKLYATEAAQKIIDSAVQLHGGLGVVSGVVVERLYREIRALRIYEGTSEVQKLIIGKELLAPYKNK
jgi:acyl-CoA dehydrogenase